MVDLGKLLRLERPLASLDLETTGLVAGTDRVIQIGVTMHYPEGDRRGAAGPVAWKTFVDPEMAIPPEATQKHKITQADVTGAPTFRAIGPALAPKLTGVDFVGFNLMTFDLPFLRAEMRRVGVADWDFEQACVVDVQAIYRRYHPRTLEDCYKEYVDPAGFPDAHDAGNDVAAHEACLAGQLARHQDVPRMSVHALMTFCFPRDPSWVDKSGKVRWRGQDACLAFGKHNGTPLRALDRGYLDWALRQDFPADVKALLRDALAGRYPRKEA